jgi:tmRNA-binding protein
MRSFVNVGFGECQLFEVCISPYTAATRACFEETEPFKYLKRQREIAWKTSNDAMRNWPFLNKGHQFMGA